MEKKIGRMEKKLWKGRMEHGRQAGKEEDK